MNAPKFTPGPWEADLRGRICGRDGEFVAEIFGHNENDDRLIATAPELYAAAQIAADTFRHYELHHANKGDLKKAASNSELAQRIEEILAKARGDE